MKDANADLKAQLREAETKVRVTEAALKNANNGRLKVAIWSAIAGFLLFAIGGQWYPGYQLDSNAEANASKMAMSAVSEVMAQLCAERFTREAGLESRKEAFDKAGGDWNKASYLRDGTWATAPDGEKADHATAEKCRGLIVERLAAAPEKTS